MKSDGGVIWAWRAGLVATGGLLGAGIFAALSRWSPGGFVDRVSAWVREAAKLLPPEWPIEIAAGVAVAIVLMPVVEWPAQWLSNRFRAFDDALLGRIGRAKPFDPFRGLEVADFLGANRTEGEKIAAALLDDQGKPGRKDLGAESRRRRLLFPLPFPHDDMDPKRRPALAAAWNDLLRFARADVDASGPAGGMRWTILTGRNGIGKSRLALEFARYLAQRPKPTSDAAKATTAQRFRVFREAIFNRSQAGIRWDAGWIGSVEEISVAGSPHTPRQHRKRLTESYLSRLSDWRPRRPTILVLDDAYPGDAARVINALSHASHHHPVRLIIVGASVAEDLQLEHDAGGSLTPLARFDGKPIVLNDASGFDAADIRALTGLDGFRDWLPSALLECSDQSWGNRQTAAIDEFLAATEGNPFLVELALVALWQRRGIEAIDTSKLLSERADRVIQAIQSAGLHSRESLALFAAATLAGGADDLGPVARSTLLHSFPEALPADAARKSLGGAVPQDLFDGLDLTTWIPPVRPRRIGLAVVRRIIAAFEGEDEQRKIAQRIADAAWKAAPRATLRAAVTTRSDKTSDDVLARALSVGPLNGMAIPPLTLAIAYIEEAVLVPRTVWDRGCSEVSAPLWEDVQALCRNLSPEEANRARAHLMTLLIPDRNKQIVRGPEAAVLLLHLWRSELQDINAFTDARLTWLWTIVEGLRQVNNNWGLALQGSPQADLAAGILRELWLARCEGQDGLIYDELVNGLPEIILSDWTSGLFKFLILSIRTGNAKEDGIVSELIAVLSDLKNRSDMVHVARMGDGFINPASQILAETFRRVFELANSKSHSPNYKLFAVSLSVAGIRCLDKADLSAEFDRILGAIDAWGGAYADNWRSLAYLEMVGLLYGIELIQSLQIYASDGNNFVAQIGAAHGTLHELVQNALSFHVDQDDLAHRFVEILNTKIEQNTLNARSYESFMLCNSAYIKRSSVYDKLEGQSYISEWNELLSIIDSRRSNWVGHMHVEAQYASILSAASRAHRNNIDETRSRARQVERIVKPFLSISSPVGACLDAWRIHAFALSEMNDTDSFHELIDVVAGIDRLARRHTFNPFNLIVALPTALAHEYAAKACKKRGRDCTELIINAIHYQTPLVAHGAFRDTIFSFLTNLIDNPGVPIDISRSAAAHQQMIDYIGGRLPYIGSFPTGTLTDPRLNRSMLEWWANLAISQAPRYPGQAEVICVHLDATIRSADCGQEEAAVAARSRAWGALGRVPPPLHVEPLRYQQRWDEQGKAQPEYRISFVENGDY
ncbi:ATP-binding protein [Bosea sp. BK604]|uniref:ATP-binding protein n=1 Tax=Bosea sp. BK604 TaxID=2512180 RepID=UPI001052BF4F|nr:ATP-binding protein [Bosea sp. BK604]TCR62980.1 hypothetical protein EV560_10973 [Bosea sp. BK604]